jgi:hypothetical protein
MPAQPAHVASGQHGLVQQQPDPGVLASLSVAALAQRGGSPGARRYSVRLYENRVAVFGVRWSVFRPEPRFSFRYVRRRRRPG